MTNILFYLLPFLCGGLSEGPLEAPKTEVAKPGETKPGEAKPGETNSTKPGESHGKPKDQGSAGCKRVHFDN